MVWPLQDDRPGARRDRQEQAGKVKIVKLNVDENQDTARRFDVMSIPTLIVFKDGQPAKKMVGAKGKGALLEDLAEFLSRTSSSHRTRSSSTRSATSSASTSTRPKPPW